MAGAFYKACCHCARMCAPEKLSVDHILPQSKGGKLSKKNTALACKPCNVERGTQDFWGFRQKKRAEVLGREVNTFAEPPTRAEWEAAHGKPCPQPGWTKEKDDAWWLAHREPTPRDGL